MVVHDDPARRLYAKAVIRGGRLEGVIAFGKLPLVDAAIAAVREAEPAGGLVANLLADGWAAAPAHRHQQLAA